MSNLERVPEGQSRRYHAEILTSKEVYALMQACSMRAPTGLRNRALIALLYRTGLRISEALALYPKDLDVEAGTVRVLHGKGARARTVGIDPQAVAVIQHWLNTRKTLGHTNQQPIFTTLKGQPLKTPYIRALMPRLAKKAEIQKRVHAHGLRHTHAAELANENIPINIIQAQLGHTSLNTTDTYLKHIQPTQLINTIKQRTWQTTEPLKTTQEDTRRTDEASRVACDA